MQNTMRLNQQKKRINILLLICSTILVLFRTMPLFQGYFSAYSELALMAVCFLLLFPIEKKFFGEMIAVFFASALFFLFQTFCRDDEIVIDAYNILHGSLKVVFVMYFLHTNDENKEVLKRLFWLFIISISITQITSIIGLERYPLIARYSIMGNSEIVIARAYGADVSAAKLNIGGYAIAYLAPVISTVLYALMRLKKIHPIFFVAHVILTFYFIFATQFTLALILYSIALLAIIITHCELGKLRMFFFISIILFLIFRIPIAYLFEVLSENVESTILSQRFLEMNSLLLGTSIEGMNLETRLGHYSKSITIFFNNFFTGGALSGEDFGGHSAVFDYIAQGGIWALGIMVLFWRTVYKKIFKPFSCNDFMIYVVFGFGCFWVACMCNALFTVGFISNFLFCIAGFCAVILCDDSKKIRNKVME